MAKKEHRFNPQTLTYEVITAPFRLRTYRLLRKILLGFILISVVNGLFAYFFYTPKMYRINRSNRELVMKYRILQDRLAASERKIAEIRHRDQSVYRTLFSADTLALDGIYTEYPSEKYRPMADDSYSSLMIGTWKQMDALARQIYLESVSFDQLQILAKNKEKLSAAIPAIWPIDRNKLRPFLTLDRCTQSPQKCIDCEVASGCAWCQGENYDAAATPTIFQRATAICLMHKARVRANNYYWNKLFRKLELEGRRGDYEKRQPNVEPQTC